MAGYAIVVHSLTKEVKKVKIGFSWVTFFFGIFVPLFRGHFIYFFILLALSCVAGLGLFIAWFVCPFIINKSYLNWLLTQGYIPLQEHEKILAKEEEDRVFKQAMMAKMVSE